jgi:4-hydroxybenzoate polyprenyltransferase
MLKAAIETLRPRQWIKNLVIFAGIIFDGQLTQTGPLFRVSAAVIIFCLVSGMTYTINDLMDREHDRLHPVKQNRPIASGRLAVPQAILLIVLLALISLPAAFYLSPWFGLVCIGYTILMLLYSKWLKQIKIVDVMVLALGFVLRVLAGTLVIKVNYLSPWLFVLTTLLALFLGFGKRYSELKLLDTQAGSFRKVLKGYSLPLLTQYLQVILAAILITYSLYTFSAHPDGTKYTMMLTIPFVFYGIFHYLDILQSGTMAASPEEVILSDRPLQVTVFLWAASVMAILYLVY